MEAREIGRLFEKVRANRPLVHHITNYVTVNDCANITLCAGAAPVMSHSRRETGEMVAMAGALVLNIGTLDTRQVEQMLAAGRKANTQGVPVVLDPVGAGATRFRTKTSLRLLRELEVAVLKGNGGEIASLAGAGGKVRGVDSDGVGGKPEQITREYASRLGTVVAMTGPADFLSDGRRTLRVDNGHPLMGRFSGSGCMAASVTGAFAAVSKDRVAATAAALAAFGVAGEKAAVRNTTPYGVRMAIFDELFNLSPAELAERARVRKV
ncbi:MAG: hydroxyethylthiazole kinase [Euryarchaeota archaeon]|nr:hydroxyethylthiazole kinase [Euryarchaeota archaeon]